MKNTKRTLIMMLAICFVGAGSANGMEDRKKRGKAKNLALTFGKKVEKKEYKGHSKTAGKAFETLKNKTAKKTFKIAGGATGAVCAANLTKNPEKKEKLMKKAANVEYESESKRKALDFLLEKLYRKKDVLLYIARDRMGTMHSKKNNVINKEIEELEKKLSQFQKEINEKKEIERFFKEKDLSKRHTQEFVNLLDRIGREENESEEETEDSSDYSDFYGDLRPTETEKESFDAQFEKKICDGYRSHVSEKKKNEKRTVIDMLDSSSDDLKPLLLKLGILSNRIKKEDSDSSSSSSEDSWSESDSKDFFLESSSGCSEDFFEASFC